MKAYTDLEQSKKLAEILPLESADMYWWFSGKRYYIEAMDDGDFNEERDVRAWSLAALLGLMPKLYEFENDPDDGGCQPNLCKGWDNNLWHVNYRSSIYITEWYDEPIDACYEMIIKLKEQNLL